MKSNKPTLYDFIEIRYADPICSLGLTNKQLLLGSMMGRTIFYSIQDKKQILLSEQSTENITGTSIIDSNTFIVSVGDNEVFEYKIGTNGFPTAECYRNYEIEQDHNLKCESTFTMLYNNFLLLLVLNMPQDSKAPIESLLCNYTIREITQNNIIEIGNNKMTYIIDTDKIEMTNYSVPFDMTKEQLAFVEYLSDKERNIVLFNFQSKEKRFEKINKAYGHISFFKILPDKKLLFVKSYNIIELLTDEFKSIVKVIHSKGEIIAVDWTIHSDGNTIIICILDVNANITFYKEKEAKIEQIGGFNLFNLADIKQEFKDKLFFAMGYPYYIKFNKEIIVVSTDNGCFLINHLVEV